MLSEELKNLEVMGDSAPGRERIQSDMSILAIVVLYGMSPEVSPTVRTLLTSAAALTSIERAKFKVLIYDNTPNAHTPGFLGNCFEYHASAENGGLASAYNYALRRAEEEGFEWLLTLDQDTEIHQEYLSKLFELVRQLHSDDRTAAIAPCIADKGVVISPHILFYGLSKRFPKGYQGLSRKETAVINSATAWRVSAVRDIGGFNPLFWLDYLDYWVCHSIYRSGRRIYVDGNLTISHELSLLDRKNRMTAARFDNFLSAETAFYDVYRSRVEGLVLTFRVLGRLLKQIIRREDLVLRALTWSCFKRRLFQPKAMRVDNWRQAMRTFNS